MEMLFRASSEPGKREAIDVAAELRRWQADAPLAGQPADLAFPHFEPTFKFAYDLYLQWHREPLEALGERMECAYERQLPPDQRLDRETVQAIVAAVWERMGGRLCARRFPETVMRAIPAMPPPRRARPPA